MSLELESDFDIVVRDNVIFLILRITKCRSESWFGLALWSSICEIDRTSC